MKTTHFIPISAYLLLAACSKHGATLNDPKADRLEGTWNCGSAIVDGKALSDDTIKQLHLTLTESRYKTEEKDEVLFDSTYTTNASMNPMQINMVGTEGDLTGKEAQGIYFIQGDTLRICYTMPGKPRPTNFESHAGSGAYLMVWTRQKP